MSSRNPHSSQHLQERLRWHIIQRVNQDGISHEQAAREAGYHRRTVERLIARWKRNDDVSDRHGGGKCRAFDDEEMEILESILEENRHATARILRILLGPGFPRVSDRTLERYRNELGYARVEETISVADAERQIENRRAFAYEHRRSDMTTWIYIDESTMVLRDTGRYAWIKKGEPPPVHQVESLRAAVHVIGAVWNEGRAFSFYTGHMNTDKYLEFLESHILPHQQEIGTRLIVHDRASYHHTDAVNRWFHDQHFVTSLLPAHSPQFNGIEYCWSWLKRYVRDMGPTTHGDLAAMMQTSWTDLPQTVICKCIQHAQKNLRAETSS
jgi:transposase